MNPKNEIDHEMIRTVRKLINVRERDPMRAADGKSAFLSQANIIAKSISPEGIQCHKNWKQKNPIQLFENRKEHKPMLSTFASIVIALSMLLGGSGATLAAAQASEPGDLLYDIKLLSENAVLDLSSSPETKFDLALDLVDRRANEIVSLLSAGELIAPETQTLFNEQVEQAMLYAMLLPEDKVIQAFELIQNRLATQEQTFSQMQTNGSPEATAALLQTRSMIQERLQILENSQLQIMNQLQTQDQINNPEQGNSPTNFGENTQNTPNPNSGTPSSTNIPPMNNENGQGGNSPWFTETPSFEITETNDSGPDDFDNTNNGQGNRGSTITKTTTPNQGTMITKTANPNQGSNNGSGSQNGNR